MTSQHAPAVATWLLERFCADDGLAGDLMEEFRGGRSLTWYWKQAVVAVLVYPISQIREHKWLAVRAIATGLAIWYVLNTMFLKGVVWPRMDTAVLRAMYFGLMYALWMFNGWTIAKLHRPYSTAMVLAYVLWSFVASVPPVYAHALSAIDGSAAGMSLAWDIASRLLTLVTLMAGGLLYTYREQVRQMRVAAHGWRRRSHRAIAAR